MLPGILPGSLCHCWASLRLPRVSLKREPGKKIEKGSPGFKIVVRKYNSKLKAEHFVFGGGRLLLPGSHCQNPQVIVLECVIGAAGTQRSSVDPRRQPGYLEPLGGGLLAMGRLSRDQGRHGG